MASLPLASSPQSRPKSVQDLPRWLAADWPALAPRPRAISCGPKLTQTGPYETLSPAAPKPTSWRGPKRQSSAHFRSPRLAPEGGRSERARPRLHASAQLESDAERRPAAAPVANPAACLSAFNCAPLAAGFACKPEVGKCASPGHLGVHNFRPARLARLGGWRIRN